MLLKRLKENTEPQISKMSPGLMKKFLKPKHGSMMPIICVLMYGLFQVSNFVIEILKPCQIYSNTKRNFVNYRLALPIAQKPRNPIIMHNYQQQTWNQPQAKQCMKRKNLQITTQSIQKINISVHCSKSYLQITEIILCQKQTHLQPFIASTQSSLNERLTSPTR